MLLPSCLYSPFHFDSQVLDSFLHHPVDTQEEIVQAYVVGVRLQSFLSETLPQHQLYFHGNYAQLRQQSNKNLKELGPYLQRMELLIDQHEHQKYISNVLRNKTAKANNKSEKNQQYALNSSMASSSGILENSREDEFTAGDNASAASLVQQATKQKRQQASQRQLPLPLSSRMGSDATRSLSPIPIVPDTTALREAEPFDVTNHYPPAFRSSAAIEPLQPPLKDRVVGKKETQNRKPFFEQILTSRTRSGDSLPFRARSAKPEDQNEVDGDHDEEESLFTLSSSQFFPRASSQRSYSKLDDSFEALDTKIGRRFQKKEISPTSVTSYVPPFDKDSSGENAYIPPPSLLPPPAAPTRKMESEQILPPVHDENSWWLDSPESKNEAENNTRRYNYHYTMKDSFAERYTDPDEEASMILVHRHRRRAPFRNCVRWLLE